MPAAADKLAKTLVGVEKQGKYNIVIGDSLKRGHGRADGDQFSSVKYNFKPQSSLANTIPPRLTKSEAGGEAPYTLTFTPPNQSSSSNPVTYEGAQHIPKETECILLFDPAKQTFTLEKLSSAFTFNAKVYAQNYPPLPLRPPVVDGDDDEISAEEKEDDNPFDYRHFLNKKATTKTRAEQRAEKEERRKKALIAAGALSENLDESDGEKGGKDEDESALGLGITYGGRPAIGRIGKPYSSSRKTGGTSPTIARRKNPSTGNRGVAIPGPGARGDGSSSEESEADNEDNGSDDDDHYQAPPRHVPAPHKPMPAKNPLPIDDDDMELVFDFPDITPQPPEDEEEISDVDEDSDDEPKRAPPVIPAGQDEEDEEDEEDDDGFNLAEELEQALESEEDPGFNVQTGGDSEIIFEDDDMSTKPKQGAVHRSAVPMSLSRMVGGGVPDESESSEEE